MRVLAITISDQHFFVGTLAAVNSLLHYSKNDGYELDIAVVSSGQYNSALTQPQIAVLKAGGIKVYQHTDFAAENRVLGAWQLKAYAANDLSQTGYDLIIGFDSDLLFCSKISDVIAQCFLDGKFRGGKDGAGVTYGDEYAPYGIKTKTTLPYMSTSCYFCPLTPTNREILSEWALKTNEAKYGPQTKKIYAGHGDQGILNAVIAVCTNAENVELLANECWSQHWRYETDVVEWNGQNLINYTANKQVMRTLHCGGSDKFWTKKHSERRLTTGQSQRWAYAQFLRFLHFGDLSKWNVDPLQIIPADYLHLFSDALNYHQIICALGPEVKQRWLNVAPVWLDRAISSEKIHRMMSIHADGTGSMNAYIELAKGLPDTGTLVEVGSYHGGSAITVAAATAPKMLRITSVESFTGNLNNTVDGWPLPSVKTYIQAVKNTWPYLNIASVSLPGQIAANLYADNSLDMVFIDGDHSTTAVLRDISLWWPKVKRGGLIAGDDYNWASVATAVKQKFPQAQNKNSVWWANKS